MHHCTCVTTEGMNIGKCHTWPFRYQYPTETVLDGGTRYRIQSEWTCDMVLRGWSQFWRSQGLFVSVWSYKDSIRMWGSSLIRAYKFPSKGMANKGLAESSFESTAHVVSVTQSFIYGSLGREFTRAIRAYKDASFEPKACMVAKTLCTSQGKDPTVSHSCSILSYPVWAHDYHTLTRLFTRRTCNRDGLVQYQ